MGRATEQTRRRQCRSTEATKKKINQIAFDAQQPQHNSDKVARAAIRRTALDIIELVGTLSVVAADRKTLKQIQTTLAEHYIL